MSNNNGNGQYLTKTQQRGEAIDQLLNGRSDTIKASVLSYIVKFNMNPNHEFFIIFVALGTLETLIETSPKEWQQLFEGFEGELGKWTDSNLKTLNLVSEKAKITERLADNSELKNSVEENSNRFSQLESEVQKLNSIIENQNKSNPLNKKTGVWKDNLLLGLVTTILLKTGYFGWTQHQVNQNTNQKVQWLLEKANRMDCRMGIKKPGSPECRGL